MKMNKLLAALLAVMLLGMACACAEAIDPQQAARLTVRFQDEGKGLSGVQFHIYRFASVDSTGNWTVVAPFDRYRVNVEDKSESALAALASTLEGYVQRDRLSPTASAQTGSSGDAVFAGLQQGVYLVAGERCTANGLVYTIQPVLVQLPMWSTEDECWFYDVLLNAKHESRPEMPEEHKITRRVLKIWRDEGFEHLRPREIVVHLLQDGRMYDTVRLNAQNRWRWEWTELEADHQWTVVEEPLEDYSVTVTREGITFIIVNHFDPPKPPPPTPTPKPTPRPNNDPKLPQTGQLWWPVAMLACGGLLLIVLGLARRRRMW